MQRRRKRQPTTAIDQKGIGCHIISTICENHIDLTILFLIILCAFIVRYYGLMDIGITYDEAATIKVGMKYIHNIQTMDFRVISWSTLSEHGPVSKYIYGLALSLLSHSKLDYNGFFICKTIDAIESVIICTLVYIIGMEFYDRKVAISASALLAFMPVFVAHGQIAAIDTPVALFFTTTVLLFMLALKREKKSYFIASMISLGLLIDTKFNGLLAIPVILLAYLVYQLKYPQINFKLKKMFNDGQKRTGVIGHIDSFLPVIPFTFMGIVSLITIYVIWPYLWTNPLNIRNSFNHWSYVPSEYLLGNLYQPVPPTYFVIYFLVTTPMLLFIPMASGIIEATRKQNPFKLIILFWFVVPFLYSFSPFKQDGMRYLLMIYPPLALICADGILTIAERISSRWPKKLTTTTAFYVITGSLVLYLLVILASFYPYYLDYYNLAGGSSKDIYEKKLFEFGWWGEGIYDSVMYVERSAYPDSNVYIGTLPYHVVYFYGKNMNYIEPGGNLTVPYNADYIITNAQAERYWYIHFNRSDFRLVHETDVHGAPLAKVYKRVAG